MSKQIETLIRGFLSPKLAIDTVTKADFHLPAYIGSLPIERGDSKITYNDFVPRFNFERKK